MKRTLHLLCATLAVSTAGFAELKLPAIIGDNMVLQQKQSDPVWGWDAPGTKVTVAFAGQTKTADADKDGKWLVKLDPMPANAKPQSMTIKGTSEKTLQNILIGEVWVCSGQSNMGFTVGGSWDADLETATAKFPNIRLISVPQVGTQEIQKDFNGQWEACSPANVGQFTAVGFFFGRTLHQMLDVPIGLIDNAWGGSAAEAWLRRDVLEGDKRFASIIERWKGIESTYDFEKDKAAFEAAKAAWPAKVEEAKTAGKPAPQQPRAPQNQLAGQHRPGNLYAGVLAPTIGYGIKGAIWYQGETNAGRAFEYRDLFPAMIEHWRKEWKQGDFPFYWVQLADFQQEKPEPGDSAWAELREAQTLSQKVPNSGQAIITDLGEANDIHPKNKRDVADRLVRLALAKDYGIKIPYRSPEYKAAEFKENKAIVTIDTFGSTLRTVDVNEVKGFAICGEDKKWQWAEGKIIGKDKVEVWSAKVAKPIAVRFAWADNPVFNLYSVEGLPVTPFRSDDFEMVTKPKPPTPPAAPTPAAAPAPKPAAVAPAAAPDKEGFVSIFDGKTLNGWHVSAKSGHSRTTQNKSGGKWEVVDGAITGSQDVPGNGGLVLTDEKYSQFEIKLEMKNDFGPDSGLFLRSTEDGKCYQGLIDFHPGGSLMGIYGEGLGGKPHVRFFSFGKTESEIELNPDRTPQPVAMTPEQWKTFWKAGQWNEFHMRISGGDKPTITTWINGMKIMEWTETEARLPVAGSIGLQVHGGGDFTKQFVRYRNVRVKKIQ
ncbi:MAG TPA: family 16 glycoside hydrolase [Verrucomicrobium sp.]|nr:family 16 glycoside hydrolase [Verrucomicrobium sp.]